MLALFLEPSDITIRIKALAIFLFFRETFGRAAYHEYENFSYRFTWVFKKISPYDKKISLKVKFAFSATDLGSGPKNYIDFITLII